LAGEVWLKLIHAKGIPILSGKTSKKGTVDVSMFGGEYDTAISCKGKTENQAWMTDKSNDQWLIVID